ncbi:MAG TPA: ATP-binding protein, partial [Anaerolineae bacterium]|nr:ATP-binding protein [Anaerolineae bacterium]
CAPSGGASCHYFGRNLGNYMGGLVTTALGYYIIVILLTGMLQHARAAWLMTILSVVAYLTIGWQRSEQSLDLLAVSAVSAVGLFFGAAFLQQFSTYLLHHALRQARTISTELETTNVRLREEIVERQVVETALSQERNLIANITDSMPAALITLDTHGVVLTCNPSAKALLGEQTPASHTQTLWEVCPELQVYQSIFDRVALEKGIVRQSRMQLVVRGESVYHDVVAFPLAAHDPQGVVLYIDDVTQKVYLEEFLLQSAKLSSLGGLAAGVAHEINNPLSAMMQSAQMLRLAFDVQRPTVRENLRACDVSPEGLACYLERRNLSEYLDGIQTMGERAARIVADLLSFSRQNVVEISRNDLNGLIDQTLELAGADFYLKTQCEIYGIEITRDLALDLPLVECDGQQIQQVILNLVRNAVQMVTNKAEAQALAGGAEPYQPRVTIRTLYRQAWVRLEVVDNGPGIPGDVRERLFEPFFTTRSVGQGAGVGLWVSWSIVVERHHGRIWAESPAEGGACFIVELPI